MGKNGETLSNPEKNRIDSTHNNWHSRDIQGYSTKRIHCLICNGQFQLAMFERVYVFFRHRHQSISTAHFAWMPFHVRPFIKVSIENGRDFIASRMVNGCRRFVVVST